MQQENLGWSFLSIIIWKCANRIVWKKKWGFCVLKHGTYTLYANRHQRRSIKENIKKTYCNVIHFGTVLYLKIFLPEIWNFTKFREKEIMSYLFFASSLFYMRIENCAGNKIVSHFSGFIWNCSFFQFDGTEWFRMIANFLQNKFWKCFCIVSPMNN